MDEFRFSTKNHLKSRCAIAVFVEEFYSLQMVTR
ncbi:hypothetical protein BPC006_I2136 [Burkholderia pseudomallei BPC006]|nr:hypothetical protein BPC006_I2136 [Burkholderia pseudomallei BPC006]